MRPWIFISALALSGCASIISGTTEEIAINTNPASATCGLYRQGIKIGEIGTTPGSVTVKKTKYDITVVCAKEGYQQATYLNHSGAAGATFGNIVLGGGIGWAIDSASGADNEYDPVVNLTMAPSSSTAVSSAVPAPNAVVLPASWPVAN